jgi:hypothetical protein
MAKLVPRTLGDSQITPARMRELKELAERPDSEIELSDIPELTEKFWANAVRNPYLGRRGSPLKPGETSERK